MEFWYIFSHYLCSFAQPCKCISMFIHTIVLRQYFGGFGCTEQIRGHDVACDESALTGESDELKKSEDKAPFMLSGTAVMKGTGCMLITCVGLFSEEGIIQKLITGVGVEEVCVYIYIFLCLIPFKRCHARCFFLYLLTLILYLMLRLVCLCTDGTS
jgi:hypothetical protein